MRNTYHTLPEDTALFDRLRHRAYAYTKGDKVSIIGVSVSPAYCCDYAATSSDITFWDVTVFYGGDYFTTYRHKAITRDKMERLFRSTNRVTRYYAGGVE